jgi:hypothetical protein
MGPLYYLPGLTRSVKLAELRACGLGYALEDRATPAGVETGPDGQAGVVVGDPTRVPDHKIGYYAAEQRWRKVPGARTDKGPCWVGIYPAAPPSPEDLQRLDLLSGHAVKLGDGARWRVPIARAIDAGAEHLTYANLLPRAVGVDEDGQWQAEGIVDRYAPLWEIATAWWEARVGAEETDGGVTFDFAGVNDCALAALAANYRLGKAEVALLGLLDARSVTTILDALIDWPTFEVWFKKKVAQQSAGSNSAAGPADSPPVTSPASPTSARSAKA